MFRGGIGAIRSCRRVVVAFSRQWKIGNQTCSLYPCQSFDPVKQTGVKGRDVGVATVFFGRQINARCEEVLNVQAGIDAQDVHELLSKRPAERSRTVLSVTSAVTRIFPE